MGAIKIVADLLRLSIGGFFIQKMTSAIVAMGGSQGKRCSDCWIGGIFSNRVLNIWNMVAKQSVVRLSRAQCVRR